MKHLIFAALTAILLPTLLAFIAGAAWLARFGDLPALEGELDG